MMPPAAATSLACSPLIRRGCVAVAVSKLLCETITGFAETSITSLATATSRVSEIDDDPGSVHLPDDRFSQWRQSLMNRRLGLDVADLVHVIMNEGNGPHAIAKCLVDAVETVFDEVATLHREDGGRLVVLVRGVGVRGTQALRELAVAEQCLQ